MTTAPRTMTAREWTMLLVLAILWAGSFFFFKVLVAELPPIGAIALGVAFLGEALTWQAIAGMALIGVGLAAIDWRLWRWFAMRRGSRTIT